MYVENDALFTFTKIGQDASKKSFPLVYKTLRVICINSSIEVVNIWTIASSLSVQPFLWFPLVPCGFPLVILGYMWLLWNYEGDSVLFWVRLCTTNIRVVIQNPLTVLYCSCVRLSGWTQCPDKVQRLNCYLGI